MGIHLNFDEYLASPPSFPTWLNAHQEQDWQRRGIVVWDADLHMITHPCASYALELLKQMRENDIHLLLENECHISTYPSNLPQ